MEEIMEDTKTGKLTIQWEKEGSVQTSSITMMDDVTWKKPYQEFIMFLAGMGYILPDNMINEAWSE